MNLPTDQIFPFQIKLSFEKVIQQLKKRYEQEQKPQVKNYLAELLQIAEDNPARAQLSDRVVHATPLFSMG